MPKSNQGNIPWLLIWSHSAEAISFYCAVCPALPFWVRTEEIWNDLESFWRHGALQRLL